MYGTAKWLFEKQGQEVFFLNLTGLYMIKGMIEVGFQVEERIVYEEFEYKGKKPFTEVKRSKYYLDEKPSCYLLAITAERLKKIEEAKDKEMAKL